MLRAEKTLICGQTTYHSYMCTGTVLEARGGCNPGTKHQLMQQILGLFSMRRTVKHSTTPAKENRAIQMTDEQVPRPGLQNQQLLIFCAPKGAEETSQCSSQGCRNNTQIALLGGRKKERLPFWGTVFLVECTLTYGSNTVPSVSTVQMIFSTGIVHIGCAYLRAVVCTLYLSKPKLAFRPYNGHEKESCS